MVSPVDEVDGLCGSCGNDLRAKARFCDVCGAPVNSSAAVGEYKQVTVLFADVVGSMKLAAELETERLRDIMNELFNRAAAVVQRYQGTVDKFTGDGLMALFGAPVALEDHALRACIAALEIQSVAQRFAREVDARDGVRLQVRVGLNSGEVIAGEIGSGPGRYTVVGHPVGMAQRMESAAPAGGVLCSLSTARLVKGLARLGRIEHVVIKGADEPTQARQLVAVASDQMVLARDAGPMLGRDDELARLQLLFQSSAGRLVGVVGDPGLGKSRIISEFSVLAASQGAEIVVARCEAHTTAVAFRAVSRLLRALFKVEGLDHAAARQHAAAQCGDIQQADAQILFDALGIADPAAPPLMVSVDGRRRRLVEVMSLAVSARSAPTVLVLEDAHWIDAPSDDVLAEFAAALHATTAMMVVTFRPEFDGALRRSSDETVTLRPLADAVAVRLVSQILGSDPSVDALAERIALAAAGNPFFAAEIVRDLADRHVLSGNHGSYRLTRDIGEIAVPATVQSVLAARIDRLPAHSKLILNAAAVIGTRFDVDTLQMLLPGTAPSRLETLVRAELIDQTEFVPRQRFCFRHPLVRTVAYESQLGTTRAQTHIQLAAAIQAREPDAADENAALIAAHLSAADEFNDAYHWHMRAAEWLRPRDIRAARAQWLSAHRIADQLPDGEAEVSAMRIAPQTMLISTAFYVGSDPDADDRYREFRDLTMKSGDMRSFGVATAGRIMSLTFNDIRVPEAAALAAEVEKALENIDWDAVPEIDIILIAVVRAYYGSCRFDAALAMIDTVLARPHHESTLELAGAFTQQGAMEIYLGDHERGRRHFREGIQRARLLPPVSYAIILSYWGLMGAMGMYEPEDLVEEMREALRRAESFGDVCGIIAAQFAYGTVLLRTGETSRGEAVGVLESARATIDKHELWTSLMTAIGADLAIDCARKGRLDEAIEDLRRLFSVHEENGSLLEVGCTAEALVKLLIDRGTAEDLAEARGIVDKWETRRPGIPATDLWWLKSRALLASAEGNRDDAVLLAKEYLELCERLDARGRLREAREMVGAASPAEG